MAEAYHSLLQRLGLTLMANANYMCCSMGKDARIPSFGDAISVPTVSLFQIKMQRSWDAAASDNEIICVATFGD